MSPEQCAHPTTLAAETRLAILVNSVQEYAIFCLDTDGAVATWNWGAQRIKGYDACEIIGRNFSVFYTPDDIAAGKPERELEIATTDGAFSDEGWRVRKDGTQFWANVVITAVFDAGGRLEGFAKVTRDETERNLALTQARRMSLLVEREQIAAGLGDGMVHRIFEAVLMMQSSLKIISEPAAAKRIKAAVDLLDETIKEIRAVAVNLTVDA